MKMSKPKLLTAALLLCVSVQAQFKLPINNAFRNDVQKVVADFPSQFASLRGDVVAKNPQTVEFASLVKVDKAENCSIIQYSANTRPVYSWHATMLSTEDFAEAEKKYKWLFNQLKGMNVKYVVDQYTLRGQYEVPAEERKFTISQLTVANPPMALQKLRVEVAMQFEFPEWKVSLSVFEKERDDDERGELDDE
jgi:hypothetical protein